MDDKDKYVVVAEACRVEFDDRDGSVLLVFNIVDEKFKRKIKRDWTQDIDLKIIDKKLYKFNEDK